MVVNDPSDTGPEPHNEGASERARRADDAADRTERRRDARERRSRLYGPSEEEIDDWIQEEREARTRWLNGPTEDEVDDWVADETMRRCLLRAAYGRRSNRYGACRFEEAMGDILSGVRGLFWATMMMPMIGPSGICSETDYRRRRIDPR